LAFLNNDTTKRIIQTRFKHPTEDRTHQERRINLRVRRWFVEVFLRVDRHINQTTIQPIRQTMDEEYEDIRWEYKEEIRRDINRHRGLTDFDIDANDDEEEDNNQKENSESL
jgi:hypothetical protein